MPGEANQLTSLHDSMRRAAFKAVPGERTVVSVSMPIHVKDAASDICVRNGTTLSGFLAQVCVDILGDYIGLQDN